MKRNEACELLTKIASSEFVDEFVSRGIYTTRDICVCSPNKILNVLATETDKKNYAHTTSEYLQRMIDSLMLRGTIMHQCESLREAFIDGFEDGCDECFLTQRCQKCPNYRGQN